MTITMYGADWCGDCRRAKSYFEANDVAYEYIDLVATPEATEVVLERNGGKQRIPVIIFDDDTHLTEPTNDELAAKLASLAEGDDDDGPEFVVTKNDEAGRFELSRNGELLSFAKFTKKDQNITVPYVETLPEHRGNGYGGRLMDGLLEHLRASERTITPQCPFAAGHIADNPQYQDLVA